MNSITEKGVMRIDVQVSIDGPMPREQHDNIQRELLQFFKNRKLNVQGDIKYIAVSTFGVEANYSNLDTSTT